MRHSGAACRKRNSMECFSSSARQRDGTPNSPIPGCQMVDCKRRLVAAKDSLGPIRSEFSSNSTRALPCVPEMLVSNGEPMK